MYVSCNFCYPSFALVLTKTQNNMKQPTTSKEQPETTYSVQEMT